MHPNIKIDLQAGVRFVGRMLSGLGRLQARLQRTACSSDWSRIALDSAAHGVCLFDPLKRLLLRNPAFLTMYGLASDAAPPACSAETIFNALRLAGVTRNNGLADFDACFEAARSAECETEHLLPDGRLIKVVYKALERGGWLVTHEDATAHRVSSERAGQAHDRLREAIDILPHGLVFIDAEGRYLFWNQQYADIYKRSADLFEPGIKFEETLRIGVARGDYPDAIGREDEWIEQRLSKLNRPQGRHEQTLADGRCILIEERRTSDGGAIGLRVDITEMKQREASFRLLFEGNPVPMYVYSVESERIINANEAALQHYGYSRAELLRMSLRHVHECKSYDRLQAMGGLLSSDQVGQTWTHLKRDGALIDVAVYARALSHDNVPACLMAVVDITERRRSEARIAHMAHHDALTGLPNRVLLRVRMEQALGRMGAFGTGVALLCIDLDNFKSINDTLGHPCGDTLLQQASERIAQLVRGRGTAARLGGDEFAILLANVSKPDEAAHVAQQYLDVLAEPFQILGHQVSIGSSVGIAVAPMDGTDPDKLLARADMALYRAKSNGKGSFHFFEPEMDARAQERRLLEIELRRAARDDLFEVHYQPLVHLAGGAISGFEALLRWPHPERGLVPPSEFLPVAEETGLIATIGAKVLRQACVDACRWPATIKLAVNLSPVQFRTGNLFAIVKDALSRAGCRPGASSWRLPRPCCWKRASRLSPLCMRCAPWACASPWTISAQAIRP